MVNQIYPTELNLNKANPSDTEKNSNCVVYQEIPQSQTAEKPVVL